MADEWIKMRRNLAGDPAVIAIARTLNLKPYEIVGMLHCFWSWADEHTVDGFIASADARFVDDLVRRKGFAAAMHTQRWLGIDPNGITIPKFTRHNGKSAKVRAGDSLRKRETREQEKRDAEAMADVQKMSGQNTDERTDETRTRSRSREEEESKTEKSKALVGLSPDQPPKNGHDKGEQTRQMRSQAVDVLTFLNLKTGRNYQPVAANVDHIVARFREGFTPSQCRQVIAKKAREWGSDERMEEYIRPKTLFNATNFANYAGELVEIPEASDGV